MLSGESGPVFDVQEQHAAEEMLLTTGFADAINGWNPEIGGAGVE